MKVSFASDFFFFISFVCLSMLASSVWAKAAKDSTYVHFKKGEVLEYRIHYGIVDAGTARIEITEEVFEIAGRDVFHVVGTGKSQGAFDWFFKVRDRYESYIDAEGVYPWMFVRRVDEGGYIIDQDYTFYQHKQKVDNGEGQKFDVPVDVQDMISAFYHARTMNFDTAKIDDVYSMQSFVDDEIWPLNLKFKGTDTIRVNGEHFSCFKFVPVVQQGRIFKQEEDLMVWVTADENKIPVLARAKILVGSIKMELQSYDGLASPIALVKD